MGKLTILEIAKILVAKNGLEQREANQFVSAMFDIIHQRLEEGEQVKVKGLGTFKMISVDARESISVRTGERVVIDSHSKVTFTPDATMKELVNKPFSQFETVLLNDGVEFEDLKDDLTEEELEAVDAVEQVADETPVAPVEEEKVVTVEEEKIAPVEEDEPAPVVEDKPVLVVEDEPTPDKVDEPTAIDVEESAPAEPDELVTEDSGSDDEEEEESHPWGAWLLGALGVLALMAASAFGGYYYAANQHLGAVADTVLVRDTVYMAELTDSLGSDNLLEEQTVAEQPVAEQAVEQPTVVEKNAVEPSKIQSAAEPLDEYAQKDERVRLGAYRIVGLSHEVKVLEGQTFYSICRAHLGPDMECYVEVYNNLPRSPKIKVGQTIKIPKLQLKKRKK